MPKSKSETRKGKGGFCLPWRNRKGNDQVRFELTYIALNPKINIISAWKDDNWTFDSRESMFDYAEKYGIPLPLTKDKP